MTKPLRMKELFPDSRPVTYSGNTITIRVERFARTALRFGFFGQVEALAHEVGSTPSAFLFRSRGDKKFGLFPHPYRSLKQTQSCRELNCCSLTLHFEFVVRPGKTRTCDPS
jgi:hypothetical protein